MFKAELNVAEKRLSKDIDFDCLKFTIKLYRTIYSDNERDIEFFHFFTSACAIKEISSSIVETLINICNVM